MLEVRHRDPRRLPRVVPARVIWVRRPQAYRSLYHVGIEFEVPGNVWDIALPPEDWFPCPEDQELVILVSGEENLANPNQFVLRASVTDVDTAGSGPEAPANAQITSTRAIETLLLPEERLVTARADSVENSVDSSPSIAEMVRMLTAETVAKEIVRIREFIDAELQGAVDKAVDRLSHRITASSELRNAVLESPISAGKLNEASDQMTEQPELSDPQSARDAPDPVRPSARQRRAAKRARRIEKTTP